MSERRANRRLPSSIPGCRGLAGRDQRDPTVVCRTQAVGCALKRAPDDEPDHIKDRKLDACFDGSTKVPVPLMANQREDHGEAAKSVGFRL